MEVAIPSRPTMDFDFNSARTSPCITAPSTPRRFGDYSFLSAPTSPSRISEFYREFDEFSTVSSNWEEEDDEPRIAAPPKSADDFAFDVGEEVDRVSLSAEELFDGGVIRPLKPPPPPSPQSSTKKMIRQALSPRRKKDRDSFPYGSTDSTPMESTQKKIRSTDSSQHQRGRVRAPPTLSSSTRRPSRSLSPLRVSEFNWAQEEEEQKRQQAAQNDNKQLAAKGSLISSAAAAAFNSCKASKKWRLKDFLLFRSASEGRATDKDPFRKFTTQKNEHVKTASSSFRSIDSPASVSSSRRRGPSAHELHYTVNKAVSDDMKKKTFLPYKQGILGRLAFNPAVVHSLASGFGSLARS